MTSDSRQPLGTLRSLLALSQIGVCINICLCIEASAGVVKEAGGTVGRNYAQGCISRPLRLGGEKHEAKRSCLAFRNNPQSPWV